MKMALLLLLTLFASLCFGMHPTGDLNEDCLHCRDCERRDACDQLECSWCGSEDCPCRGCDTKYEKDQITINVNCGTSTGRCSKGTLCRSGDLFDCCNVDEQCMDGACVTIPSPLPPFLCPRGTLGVEPEQQYMDECVLGADFGRNLQTIVAYYGTATLSSGDTVDIIFGGGGGLVIEFSSNDRCPFFTERGRPCIAERNVSIQATSIRIVPGIGEPNSCSFIFCLKRP